MVTKFPDVRIAGAETYARQYFEQLARAATSIRPDAVRAASVLLKTAIENEKRIYVCGNGGSSAISNHMHCDFAKGVRTGTSLLPRIVSLAANLETIMAIGNDIGFDDVFIYQLKGCASPGDVLITISSSGNSENVVRPLQWARENDLKTIALTGFDGGRSARLADVNLHVEAHNYGIVEDIHQSLVHILAQYLRQGAMDEAAVAASKF